MSEEREKKIIRLFHLQGYDQMVDQIFEIILSKSETEGLSERHRKVIQKYAQEVKRESFDLAVELISRSYTDEEINFLFETATHPIQQSIQAKSPMLMTELAEKLSTILENKSEEIERELNLGYDVGEWDEL